VLGILGNKVGMTQIFTENGDANAVTVIKVGPCIITQIKSVETHGYNSIQIGYKEVSKTKLTKPELGHLEKSNILPLKYLKEYEVPNISDFELGQVINVQKFTVGEFVDITGKSIGKGFAGNQKRHNFSRGPMTHGSKNHREPGSIGQGSTPARVFPGKKMYGKLGDKQTTVSNLQILKIDTEENLLIVKGAVPGKPGNLLSIKPTKRV
jgi:large subunit ribosomal protein L3|tara:strand:- start:16835 stop:17461 length:627 start_codon:yes stop_codon:yes gene_type:complete